MVDKEGPEQSYEYGEDQIGINININIIEVARFEAYVPGGAERQSRDGKQTNTQPKLN
jgi:hypothetical protein